jgi:hypothetical protein
MVFLQIIPGIRSFKTQRIRLLRKSHFEIDIKKIYINENFVIILIYYKVQIYF